MIDRDTNNHENLQLYCEERPLTGRLLIVDDFPTETNTLTDGEAQITYWHTRYNASHEASTTPPGDALFDTVLIRLPKSHEYFDFVLQMVSSHISPKGKVFVYGLNDEGIKGAAKKLKEFYGNVETMLIKNHGRILSSEVSAIYEKKRLSDFASKHVLTYDTKEYEMTYYPGMFAPGTLDVGTELLLDSCIPLLKNGVSVLDYACGSGIIARVLLDKAQDLTLDLLDNDTLSLEAAKHNVPQAESLKLEEALESHPHQKKYDLIVSNPPIHTEKNLQYETLCKLIQNGFQYLLPGGRLIIVVQARIKVEDRFESVFGNCTILAETTRFKVLEGIR